MSLNGYHIFCSIVTLVALFAFCGECKNATLTTGCANKYYLINTYEDINGVASLTCYGESVDCIVLRSLPGQPDNLQTLATIPAGKTIPVFLRAPLGSVLRSNAQFDCKIGSIYSSSFNVMLPRATAAGENFALRFEFPDSQKGVLNETCSVFSFSKPATFTVRLGNGPIKAFDVGSYRLVSIVNSFAEKENVTLVLRSRTPVIVSCISMLDGKPQNFYTWEPISSEPVLGMIVNGHASVTISDCRTNDIITDYSLVSVEHGFKPGGWCSQYGGTEEMKTVSISGKDCVFLVQPLNNLACVSITRQTTQSSVAGTALVGSKSFLKVAGFPTLDNVLTNYNGSYPCTVTEVGGAVFDMFNREFENGNLPPKFVYGSSLRPLNTTVSIACKPGVFSCLSSGGGIGLQDLGLQSISLWNEVFVRDGCV